MKSKILLLAIFIFVCIPFFAKAQVDPSRAMSPEMALLENFCLTVRAAFYNYDIDALKDAASGWDIRSGSLLLDGKKIIVVPYEDLVTVDGNVFMPLSGHIDFYPDRVKMLAECIEFGTYSDIVYDGILAENSMVLRKAPYDCQLKTVLVPADGTLCLQSDVSPGWQELLVIAERESLINVTMEDTEGNKVVDSSEKGLIKFVWRMKNSGGHFALCISNPTDTDISIAIVSN